MQHTFTPVMWMENFRVSRETFIYICEQLQPKIVKITPHLGRHYLWKREWLLLSGFWLPLESIELLHICSELQGAQSALL